MKRYILLLLCGALILGFTACDEPYIHPIEDKNDVAAFCNSLLGMSVEEANQTMLNQGFVANPHESSYNNTPVWAEMGGYTSSAGCYVYEKRNPQYSDDELRTYITIQYLNGSVRTLHYQISTYAGSLKAVALNTEKGLRKIAKRNRWDVSYHLDMLRSYTRDDIIATIKDHSLGHNAFYIKAEDVNYPQSLVEDGSAYGLSYTHKVAVDSMLVPSGGLFSRTFVYQIEKEYCPIPQALYMPDYTIRVGEYLQKAFASLEDVYVGEQRLHCSRYLDKDFFMGYTDIEGCFYACGLAYFAPAGALDLEANMVTHTSSDESILKVEQDECQAGKEHYEKIRIKAVAPGKATLTVRWKDLSTTATITVVE